MRSFRCLLILVFIGSTALAQAPDTVLSFQEAKVRLLNYNLGLLASYYDIGIAKAKVIQARVWNNPNFIVNGDMYNQETNEYFNLRSQSLWQFEQTFSIAGKHTNSVRLARTGVEMAEKQMEDVIRSLLFALWDDPVRHGPVSACLDAQLWAGLLGSAIRNQRHDLCLMGFDLWHLLPPGDCDQREQHGGAHIGQ